MNLEQARQTFIAECRELLEEMENALLAIGQTPGRTEAVNGIFRAVHTIKGSAGLFGLDNMVAFSHVVESVLDRLRDGKLAVGDALVALLLACGDHLGVLVDTIDSGHDGAAQSADGAALVARLQVYLDTPACAPLAALPGEVDRWHLSLRFGPDVLRNGMDPLSILRYLGTLGQIVAIETLPDAIPTPAQMDPESCYLGFEIAFDSQADKAAIEGAFEFVRDDASIRILPPHSRAAEYLCLIATLPEEANRLGEILIGCGSITRRELAAALAAQSAGGALQLGTIMVEQGAVQPAVVEAALAKQQQVRDAKSQESSSIRVDAEKLDQLINLVGELIIAAAGTNLVARRIRNVELQERTDTLADLVERVRDSALQLRMVKIGATFKRFQRVVHDVAREIGKDIALALCGEDTELDKTVVEKLADPLTHLVRNAVDHGIEPAALRLARGKPAQGAVRLNAYHDSGSIVIEVSDDGGGLKRDKILAKALERGLVEPGRVLSDSEIYALVFEPGFSTAEQVTNLSGRGVGMDVVKRNIAALRGSVAIDSEDGVGTTVTVRLPLTLAIIDGFLVGVGTSTFVIPLEMIEECVEFSAEHEHDYTDLRGQVLPFIVLSELFGVARGTGRRQSIVVVRHAGRKAGLVVDTLLGEFQTVIKPLGKMFGHVKRISGSTILGSGEVALILDVPALMQCAVQAIQATPASTASTTLTDASLAAA